MSEQTHNERAASFFEELNALLKKYDASITGGITLNDDGTDEADAVVDASREAVGVVFVEIDGKRLPVSWGQLSHNDLGYTVELFRKADSEPATA